MTSIQVNKNVDICSLSLNIIGKILENVSTQVNKIFNKILVILFSCT